MLAAGFGDSSIRVWSLTGAKLCAIKPPDELNLIDKEAGTPSSSFVNLLFAAEIFIRAL